MAHRIYLVRTKFTNQSGVADDVPGNDFVFDGPTDPPALGVAQLAEGFFNTAFAGMANPLSHYLSALISRAANMAHTTLYDISGHLDGSAFGPPVFMHDWTLGPAGPGQSLPRATAVCVDYHGALGALAEFGPAGGVIPTGDRAQDEGAPATHLGRERFRSRARGRLFIGPLHNAVGSTIDVDGNNEPVIGASLLTDLGTLMHQFLAQTITDGTPWQVWSRRDAVIRQVIGGWVPTGFSSLRKRQIEAPGKVQWS